MFNFAAMFEISVLILSVILGSVLAYFFSQTKGLSKFLLTFSGAFFMATAVLEIFPEVYHSQNQFAGIFVLAGLLFQMLIESMSKGVEHGHVHFENKTNLPAGIFLGLFLHSFFEGTPLLHQPTNHLLWAIFIHNIPISMVLFGALWKMKTPVYSKMIFLAAFAVAGPLGALAGDFISEPLQEAMLAFVAGIFIHIATVILFESSSSHKFKAQKILSVLLGFVVAYLIIA